MKSLLADAHVVTMDDAETRARGRLDPRRGRLRRSGRAARASRRRTSASTLGGAVVTPGLVNTHHHLYQTLTRARAQQATLFEWLVELYPTWARIDAEAEYAAARTGLAELMLSGCTTVFDHHYVFPRGRTGLVEAEVQAAHGARLPPRRLARLDGPRRLRRRPAARRARRGDRRRARRHGAARRRAARDRPGRAGPDRGRALLAVLRHRAADDASRPSSRAASACSCTRTSRRRSRRRRTARSSTAARPSSTSTRSAGSTATSGARTASTSRRAEIAPLRRDRHRRRPLPDLEPPARRRRRARARDARRRRARRPRRRRLGLERAQPTSSTTSSRRCSSRAAAAGPRR